MLFCVHDYKHENGMDPMDWKDLFEFVNYKTAKAAVSTFIRAQAEAQAAATRGR